MGFKYIMMENQMFQFPVIFPDKLVHQEVFLLLRHLEPVRMQGLYGVARSAGVIEQLYVKGVGGKSETMGLASRGEVDQRIINMYNYEHGIRGL